MNKFYKTLVLTFILSLSILNFAFSAFAQTPISYGQTLSGSISAAGQKNDYTFSGANGEVITLRFAKTSGTINLYVELFNPQGTRITYSSSGVLNTTLTSTGTFKFTIRDYSNTATGAYSLSLQRVNPPVGATALTFGQNTQGTIDTFTKIVAYSLSAAANDTITLRFARLTTTSGTGTFNPNLELYDSAGTKIASSLNGILTQKVSTTGSFYILVTDAYRTATGTYELTLQRMNNPANVVNLNYNQVMQSTINNPTGMNVYKLNAAINSPITICSVVSSTISGSFSVYLELYDASGNLLKSSFDSLQHTFTSGGTVYLFISNTYRSGTGVYRFILKNGTVSCASTDLIPPQVSLLLPHGGEIIESGSTYTISWSSSDNVAVTYQEIRLSADSGATYPTVIASGVAAAIKSYNWLIPSSLSTSRARIKVIVLDGQGNQDEDVDKTDFIVINTTLPSVTNINYTYDKSNRLTQSSSTTPSSATIYTYDSLGNRLNINSK